MKNESERSAEEILKSKRISFRGERYRTAILAAMEEYASQFKLKDGYYSHQLDRIHELTHKVAGLEKENARLTEVEECNKCTILNQRQTIAELKSESLPEATDEQIKLDLKLHGRAYYLTDDNGRKERIDPLRLITVFESKEDNKAWKDSYEEGEAG